ncbi:hypothetical protein ATANTOWER_020485 [Ataeniobius toweri]|uniref:Uncharacterized protein n=1 Tax=Ataeniobius toweri TaxID=208326 RepID=A0ABU7BAB1_9TELE|nr:hypothetical protein [Ataeniobius toweri]
MAGDGSLLLNDGLILTGLHQSAQCTNLLQRVCFASILQRQQPIGPRASFLLSPDAEQPESQDQDANGQQEGNHHQLAVVASLFQNFLAGLQHGLTIFSGGWENFHKFRNILNGLSFS